MKKIVSLLLVLLAALTLVACADENENVDPDIAIVQGVKDSLTIGYKSGDDGSKVTQDITLKTSENGVAIAWKSDKANVVNQAGRVNRPADANTEVTLTADLTKGKVNDSRTFKVTVLKQEVKADTPVFVGIVEDYMFEVTSGEEFDPLEGITATSNGVDVSDTLASTFKPEWLETAGLYDFVITAKSPAGTEARVNVSVNVKALTEIFLSAPNALTYYIGSRTFNPLEEVRAFTIDPETDEEVPVNVTIAEENYTLRVPGEFSFTVEAAQDGARTVSKEIKLTVKAKHDIPNELPKGEKITIEMWHSNGSSIETALKKYATNFQTLKISQGYDVEVIITKNGSNYDELKTNVINAGKGGTLPQIVQNYPDHLVEYHQNGYIEPLAPYIYSPVHGFKEDVDNDRFTDILEGYRSEQRATNLQGEYLSLPFNKSTEVMSYNKDIFDEILKGAPMPTTWQGLFDLQEEIDKVKDKHIDAIRQRRIAAGVEVATADADATKAKAQFVPYVYDSSANAFITLTRQFGGSYTSLGANGKGSLDFATDLNTIGMLSYFGLASQAGLFTVPAKWEAGYTNEVSKYGMAIAGIGSTGGVRYNTPEENGYKIYNIGIAPVPYDQDSPQHRTVIQQGTNLSIMKSGTAVQKLMAWEFIKYLTSQEVQLDFSLETGYSPVRDSVYTSERFLQYLDKADEVVTDQMVAGQTQAQYRANFELVVKAMGLRAAAQQRAFQFTDTPFIGSSAARTAVGSAFDRIMLPAEPITSPEQLGVLIGLSLVAAKAEAEKAIA